MIWAVIDSTGCLHVKYCDSNVNSEYYTEEIIDPWLEEFADVKKLNELYKSRNKLFFQ